MIRSVAAITLMLLAASSGRGQQDWTELDRRAEELYTKGDLKEAIRVARLAVTAASDAKQSARSLDRLGFFEYTAGDLKAGESDLRQALKLRSEKIGIETADYAESANDLALFCRDSNKLPEARTLAEQAVAIRTRVLGPRDLSVAESLNTLASVFALLGEYDLAIVRFEEARGIHESREKAEDLAEEYGTLCINLAGTYHRVGRYAQAEAMFVKGLDVLRRRPGTDHPAYSASLVAYAYLQADLGHYSAAEKLYNEGGELLRKQLGDQHPVYAAFLNNRATLYTALGNVAVAEADYRKSLELKRKAYGPTALTVGASLRNLGRLVDARNPEEGGKIFQEAVDLYRKNPEPPAFDYASALLGLAGAQRRRGELGLARVSLTQASDVVSAKLGAKHPLYAAVLRDLALVEQSARQYDEAKRLLRQAIGIIEASQGEDHPDLAPYLARLGAVYEETGDYQAAEPLYRRSLDLSDRARVDMLTVGSESNKMAVLANLEDPIPALLAFQRKAGPQLPAARSLAFEAVIRREGRVLDEVQDWEASLRDSQDSSVRSRFSQRQAMLECEASLTIALGYRDLKPAVVGTCALPGTEFEGRYGRLLHDLRANWNEALSRQALQAVKLLKQRIDTLDADLSRAIPQFASMVRPPRLEDIRTRLKPDELLVEFVAFADRDSQTAARRYGAFVLGRTGDLLWIELGTAGAIDRAVQDLIAAANDWSTSLAAKEERGAASAEGTAKDALQALSAKLRPVIAEITRRKDVQRLRIAPDGMLNLVPFAAVTDDRGVPLVEHFAISEVSAGRDLADSPVPGRRLHPGATPVIAVSPGSGTRESVPQSGAPNTFRADRLERLAGAEREARDVRNWMPRAQLLGERQATEQRMKQLHGPSVLHIIGHGIVRGNEDCRQQESASGCGLSGLDSASRVMSLSAIVLEEAYGRGDGSSQDGFLTALELQTMDLHGTEMLVLSQCRMADGVPSSGEGVFGMRRAAAIAGAKTFVAPLWRIADSAQQTLMHRFYSELSAGTSRAEALRRAQVQLLRTAKTAGFLQWAPVMLSGDPEPLQKELFAR